MLYISDLGFKSTETACNKKHAEVGITKTNSIIMTLIAWPPSPPQYPEMLMPLSQWADRVGRTYPVPTLWLADPSGYVVTFPSYAGLQSKLCKGNRFQLSKRCQNLPASRSSGQPSCSSFWRSQVHILAEASCGSSQSSRQISRLYFRLSHDRFPPHPFQFIITN